MTSFYLWIVVFSTLQNNVWNEEPCGERYVTGAVGGAVTLNVGHTRSMVITWSFGEGSDIAITLSVGSPVFVNNQYKGRLISTSVESLTITKLRQEDQGTYLARIGIQRCYFHLTVFNVWNEEPCGERNVTGAVGGAVTLSVGQTELKVITWSYGEEGAIAITISVDSPIIVNGRYEGRLISTSIESLTITELRQEDQGTYLTQIGTQRCRFHLTVFSNLTAEDISIKSNVMDNNTCEISFTCSVNGSNVSITWRSLNHLDIVPTRDVVFVPPSHINFTYICTARNPVSTASKLVHPWEYCKRENTSKLDYTIGNLVRLVISGCVLMISCCILIHHMKTEVFTQRPGSGGI